MLEQPSRSSFPEKRKAAETHIDLWLDGSIYPSNPHTGKHHRFDYLKELLEFVGDGDSGLFGYVQSLCSESVRLEYIQQIAELREEVCKLQQQLDLQQGSLNDIPRFEEEIRVLQAQKTALEEHLEALQIEVHVGYVEKLASALELNLAKQSHDSEHDSLISVHKNHLETIQFKLSRTKLELSRAVTKFNKQ